MTNNYTAEELKVLEDLKMVPPGPDNTSTRDTIFLAKIAESIGVRSDKGGIMLAIGMIAMAMSYGICSKATPMETFIKGTIMESGKPREIRLTKKSIMRCYYEVFKNKNIRSFAIRNNQKITSILETKGWGGDLAKKYQRWLIDNQDREGFGAPATEKELAYASSFNQKNPLIYEDPELTRVKIFLEETFITYEREYGSQKAKRGKAS